MEENNNKIKKINYSNLIDNIENIRQHSKCGEYDEGGINLTDIQNDDREQEETREDTEKQNKNEEQDKNEKQKEDKKIEDEPPHLKIPPNNIIGETGNNKSNKQDIFQNNLNENEENKKDKKLCTKTERSNFNDEIKNNQKKIVNIYKNIDEESSKHYKNIEKCHEFPDLFENIDNEYEFNPENVSRFNDYNYVTDEALETIKVGAIGRNHKRIIQNSINLNSSSEDEHEIIIESKAEIGTRKEIEEIFIPPLTENINSMKLSDEDNFYKKRKYK